MIKAPYGCNRCAKCNQVKSRASAFSLQPCFGKRKNFGGKPICDECRQGKLYRCAKCRLRLPLSKMAPERRYNGKIGIRRCVECDHAMMAWHAHCAKAREQRAARVLNKQSTQLTSASRMPKQPSKWKSPDRLRKLKELLMSGKSRSEIGDAIGETRNAVIGAIDRHREAIYAA